MPSFSRRIYAGLVAASSAAFALAFYPFIGPLARLASWRRRRSGRKLRILYGPSPIVSIVYLARADRLQGRASETLVYGTYYITRDFDFNLGPFMESRILRLFVPPAVFLWALVRYDVFQFFANRGLLSPWGGAFHPLELPLLRAAGKTVIVSAYGADVRTQAATRALGAYNCCSECPAVGRACVCSEDKWAKRYRHLRRWSNAVLSMGDMKLYTPGSRNDLFYWPVDTKEVPFVGAEPRPGPVRVVHAPNHRHFKGTHFLEEAVARLRGEGLSVELQIVEKVSRSRVLEACREADIVADQFLVGFHGYFALEAMALGKPVLCYLRKPAEDLADWERCPLVNAEPGSLADVLRGLVLDGPRRSDLGRRGRRYVEEHFSLEACGRRMDALYRELTGR